MNKEEIYDSKIAPLMTQIIDICKTNKIAMLASFFIPAHEDDDLICTTALLADDFDPPKQLIDALNVIRPPSRSPMMLTTRDADGNAIRIDSIL